MARIWKVPARHGSVPNAYTKAGAEEGIEVYIFMPEGMEISEEVLCRLGVRSKRGVDLRQLKSLYGLKQAGRMCNQLLIDILIKLGYKQYYTDSCSYYKHDEQGTTIVGVYVDDLLVTATSNDRVDAFCFAERQCLELKDLDQVTNVLGIHFEYGNACGFWTRSRLS
ncbi:hypothetical protein PC110_g2912 [Phytophthora cactorum]|uniref:Reverse transcriptase Ty1/copia-type domain-containing protein n=1 Tax=Phytophthora cactorum TaxID=29920 RepID=A0A329SZ26_9STRA|nr:hypothetical protein PC110_g2912 [Phytophthora cactorum]